MTRARNHGRGAPMVTVKLSYVHQDIDRHGNVRVYFWRKGGRKVRLRDPLGSPEFLRAYEALLRGEVAVPSGNDRLRRPETGTLRWLCTQYVASPVAKRLDPSTQHTRKLIIDGMLLEPIAP